MKKTAEEILENIDRTGFTPCGNVYSFKKVIKAMQIYADQQNDWVSGELQKMKNNPPTAGDTPNNFLFNNGYDYAISEIIKKINLHSFDNFLKPINGWISIKDRMPKKWVPVLIWYDNDEIITAELTDDNMWANKSISWFIHSDDVTHWRELPKPPSI